MPLSVAALPFRGAQDISGRLAVALSSWYFTPIDRMNAAAMCVI